MLSPIKLCGSAKGNELTDALKMPIDENLVKMIIIDYQPLSLIENTRFNRVYQKIAIFI